MSTIHIKEKNKGKFTAYAKAHGKSVQQMASTILANKDKYSPTIVKRANFARNSKKFHHEEGTKSLSYNKGCKYKMKSGTRKIETEGREPVFDKDNNLVYYNPNDPTHKQGGVESLVVANGKYTPEQLLRINMTSKVKLLPEGSSIITANNGLNREAINAYKQGDMGKLNSIKKEMPTDKAKTGKYNLKKYQTGTKATRGGTGYYQVSPEELKARKDAEMNNYAQARGNFGDIQDSYDSQKQYSNLYNDQKNSWLAQNQYSPNSVLEPNKTTNQVDNSNLTNFAKTTGRLASVYGTTTPIWQNLALGKQKPELQQRNYLNNVSLNDAYNISPQIQNINSVYNNQAGIVANTVGTAQNRNALQQSILNSKRGATNEVLANKANYRAQLRNQQLMNNQTINEKNLNLKNQYNMFDEQARAKVQDATTKAASQVGAFTGDAVNYLNKYKQDDINKSYTKQYFDTLENNPSLLKYKTKTENTAKKGKYKIKSK